MADDPRRHGPLVVTKQEILQSVWGPLRGRRPSSPRPTGSRGDDGA
ncbi:hypothetical protein [Rhodococcus wratislaviensis]|nr:hypothetical protein [Rhodococcus wratislaviensis]